MSVITEMLSAKGEKVKKRNSINFQLKEANAFIMEILSFVASQKGTVIQDFYVGTTNDINMRLFKGHKVNAQENRFVSFEASINPVADEVVYQLREMGMNGYLQRNSGQFVYCYLIGDRTVEWSN